MMLLESSFTLLKTSLTPLEESYMVFIVQASLIINDHNMLIVQARGNCFLDKGQGFNKDC